MLFFGIIRKKIAGISLLFFIVRTDYSLNFRYNSHIGP